MPEQMNLQNIDKKGWKKVRFDEIAFSISERVEPQQTDLKMYVGLEHLDPETIHIKRFGTPADVEGTKLKVYPGDVIFGKRRAYQRKAAIATFEGICSAHAMVLRANPVTIEPRLFPFFVHSDAFMNRAIDISVGSLSPTINWTTLKTQEFLLPPKEEQPRLAELLWAGDDLTESNLNLQDSIIALKNALLQNFFNQDGLASSLLKDIGIVFTGNTPPTANEEFWNGDIPFISPAEINDKIEPTFTSRRVTEKGLRKGREVIPGDVFVVCIGSTIGKVAIAKERCITNQQINIVRPKNPALSHFLFYNLLWHKELIISKAGATAVPILNKGTFEKISLPLSLEDSQNEELGQKLLEIDCRVNMLGANISSLRNIQKHYLINQIFSS